MVFISTNPAQKMTFLLTKSIYESPLRNVKLHKVLSHADGNMKKFEKKDSV